MVRFEGYSFRSEASRCEEVGATCENERCAGCAKVDATWW